MEKGFIPPRCISLSRNNLFYLFISDGSLGGYGGGMPRKKWLLELESNEAKKCQ